MMRQCIAGALRAGTTRARLAFIVWKLAIAAALACAILGNAQEAKQRTAHKAPPSNKPVCSPGAICFSGRVEGDEEFRRHINAEMDFVLQPGWTIAIEPRRGQGECGEFAAVANPPYRAHNMLSINATYDWTAEQEVGTTPREFVFVTNCADWRIETARLNIAMWGYTATKAQYDEAMDRLGTLATGKGRLWITGAKTSHTEDTDDDKRGKIEWMTFTVEIKMPR